MGTHSNRLAAAMSGVTHQRPCLHNHDLGVAAIVFIFALHPKTCTRVHKGSIHKDDDH